MNFLLSKILQEKMLNTSIQSQRMGQNELLFIYLFIYNTKGPTYLISD